MRKGKTMDVNEYQNWSKTTAVYPEEKAIAYLGFGVGAEWGEFIEKINEGANKEDILNEIGDYFWYLARLSDELGFELKSLFGKFDVETDPDLINFIGEITTGYIFRLQGAIKKHVRGDFDLQELAKRSLEPMEALVSGTEVLLLGHPIEDIAQRNHDKLMARKASGTIRGDGDNR